MTTTKTETIAKKDVHKLQRAIVDGLEDVKAQDIQVFDTEHLSPLFERVVVASGTSNRQTKALSASVRDAVREAGFGKPRIEGEENGEWIIVDCGAAVVHIMQPAIRQYYHLEEIWGDTPVRLKLGGAKPVKPVATRKADEMPAKARMPGKAAAGKTAVGKTVPGKTAARKSPTPARDVAAPAKAAAGKNTAPRKAAAPRRAASAADGAAAAPKAAPIKKVVIKAATRPAAKKKPAAALPRKTAGSPARKTTRA